MIDRQKTARQWSGYAYYCDTVFCPVLLAVEECEKNTSLYNNKVRAYDKGHGNDI